MNLSTFTKRLPVAVVASLLWISANAAYATDCFILSAGVDNYPHVNALKGCLADARNTSAAFRAQQGKLFNQVHSQILLDGDATHGRILQSMRGLSQKGAAGDYVVIFLSGHGGRTPDNRAWYFLPHDYQAQRHAATALTDKQILDAADVLVRQGKKVFVIIDACFAGQLGISAQGYVQNYRNPQGGGLVLMLSSSASQTSTALGKYSAFAKAFADSMVAGDLNRDGAITIDEIRRDAFQRTHNLIKQHGMSAKQDSEVSWSPSLNGNLVVARISGGNVPQPQPQPTLARTWTGSESLQGFGRLSFELHNGGRAVMHDAAGTTQGVWQQSGNQITLQFDNGRIVYTGMMQGNTILGTARNDRTSWNFSVTAGNIAPQPAPQPASQTWAGEENLQGFGQLAFVLHTGGRAVMHDVRGATEGSWQQTGNQVTLHFDNGRIVYAGVLEGNTIAGNAQNDRTTWSFRVTRAGN